MPAEDDRGGRVARRTLNFDGIENRLQQAADAGSPPSVSPRETPSAAPHGKLHHRVLASGRAFVPDVERRPGQERFASRESPTRPAPVQAEADRPQDGYPGPSSGRRGKLQAFETRAVGATGGEPRDRFSSSAPSSAARTANRVECHRPLTHRVPVQREDAFFATPL